MGREYLIDTNAAIPSSFFKLDVINLFKNSILNLIF